MPDQLSTCLEIKRLRIAFIGARGVIGTYSGIETYYEELGSRLAARGHEVTAYCRTYFTPDQESYRGIRIRRLPCVRTKHLETISHSFLSTIDSLFRAFDIVQYHAIGSAPLALAPRLLGKKTVVSVRGLDWQRGKWGSVARTVLQIGEWASVRCPSATVVVSNTLRDHYMHSHGIEPVVVRNAVVRGEHRPLKRMREAGLSRDGYFLFAGRLSPEKGVDTLLEAFSALDSDKTLALAGGTSYSEDYIEKLKQKAGKGVIFLGRVDRECMEELLSNCYAFVLPSTMEGLSIALLEAISYGACVVGSAIPENLEAMGEAGLSFPVGDVEALRQALWSLLEDPELVEEQRARARRQAGELPDWDDVTDRTEAFYRELLDQTY